MANKSMTQRTVTAAVLTAVICAVTMAVKIPSPLKGYLNLGDGVVLLAGWLLSPGFGFLAAGLGSALADIFSGYVIYAPATFIIKGLMALIAVRGYIGLRKRAGNIPSRIAAGTAAELLMVAGYYLFEGVLYGFIPALANVAANAVQGAAGLIIGVFLIKGLEKTKLAL